MYISPFEVPPTELSDVRAKTMNTHAPPRAKSPSPPPSLLTQANGDVLSELLIARLLEEDLRMLAQAKEAERIQLDQILSESKFLSSEFAGGSGGRESSPFLTTTDPTQRDSEIALEMMIAETRLEGDAAFVRELLRFQNAGIIADQQAAQKWAAAEMKSTIDAEFAKTLQKMQNEGRDISNAELQDVER